MSGRNELETAENDPPLAGRLQVWVCQWVDNRDESAARALMEALHPHVAAVVGGHAPRGVDPDKASD